MLKVIYQLIPRCVFEPVFVLAMIGVLFFYYRHWKKNKAETVFLACLFLFPVSWRVIQPIGSDRYALFLLPVMIFFMVTAMSELASIFHRFCKWPYWNILLLCAMFAGTLGKSFHCNTEDCCMYGLLQVLLEDSGKTNGKKTVVVNRDIYYFLEGRLAMKFMEIRDPGFFKDLPDGDYFLLKLNQRRMPQREDFREYTLVCDVAQNRESASHFMLWKRKNAVPK